MSDVYKSAEGARLVQARYLELLTRWPVANRHLRVPTREGETFIVACGPPQAPPLVLLHGAGANATMWMSDVATWAAHFSVYAVDVIGEPGLSAPSRPPLASGACARGLDDVLQELSLPRTSMVGVSLGGWLALDYATRRPDRVESLVLINPAGVGSPRLSFLFTALPLLLLGEWGRRRVMRLAAGRNSVGASSPADREMADFVALVARHAKPRRDRPPVCDDAALQGLTCRLLLIAGGRDATIDAGETKRRVERAVPHAEVRFLPEAGHIIQGQAAPILEFLRRTNAS